MRRKLTIAVAAASAVAIVGLCFAWWRMRTHDTVTWSVVESVCGPEGPRGCTGLALRLENSGDQNIYVMCTVRIKDSHDRLVYAGSATPWLSGATAAPANDADELPITLPRGTPVPRALPLTGSTRCIEFPPGSPVPL